MTNNKTEGVEDCKHEPIIDTGVGYYHCPGCNTGWTYAEWEAALSSFPSPPAGVEQRAKEIETVETFDLSQLPHEEKLRMLNELTMEIIKPYLGLFLSIGLKTHIEQMVIEETTGQEYVFSFRTLPEHMKKRKEEQESIAGSESQGQDWISVEDRLPPKEEDSCRDEYSEWVQCANERGVLLYACQCQIDQLGRPRWIGYGQYLSSTQNVTHWRFIPKSINEK